MSSVEKRPVFMFLWWRRFVFTARYELKFMYCVSELEVYKKILAYVLVPKSFMEFMFSTVYRVTQKDFYARPYTSVWAAVVARQISKRYSSSCHVFLSARELLEAEGPTALC